MIRKKITDFYEGRISFCASGGFCELFLNNCRHLGVSLYNVRSEKGDIDADVKYADFPLLSQAAEKSGMEIISKKKSGLLHILKKYKRRLGIPVGLLLAVIITAVLSSVIWSIDIYGNEKIPDEDIISLLSESGIKRGAFCDSVSCDDAEFMLLRRLEKLSWASVYSAGSRVFVEIREREEEEKEENKDVYTNIIASKDGEVVNADIFTGDGKIYPGTAVVKGDLLVSGVVTMREGWVKFVDAEADIRARTKNRINVSSAFDFTAKAPVDPQDRFCLYFFGISVPLGFRDKDKAFTENRYFFDSSDVVFPVGIIREHSFFFEEKTISLTEAQATLLAFFDFSCSARDIFSSCEVYERKIKKDVSSQVFITGEFRCIENIALKKQFTVEESDGDENQLIP